ncbi:hypothetical protein F0L17_14505 [Streptomyces sp. TRM43335]|uniref:Uncharacterized protein n=1 Tax=Streptomyces taklimakanensis TaxID=2569853 RepID=A0A6G2BDG6_9ACTN|nr:hypothetical protein [Streptomyces taklimakanensis]MTE20298.1 hypothetical protein [Streptomyces taklimakanensis]
MTTPARPPQCGEETDELRQAVRDELASLWHDLEAAQRSAHGHREGLPWSIHCDDLEERIKALTTLVEPTPWQNVPPSLVDNGVYQRIHGELRIPVRVAPAAVAAVRAVPDGPR